MALERGILVFEGGPNHGQKIKAWLPSNNVRYIYRSPILHDDAIYRAAYNGQNFSKYFRFYNVWKYEQDLILTPLFNIE